jgi:hypothetical protein
MDGNLGTLRRRWRIGAVLGALLLCAAPVLVIGGWALGMWESSRAIDSSPTPTPAELREGTRTSMGFAVAGILAGVLGGLTLAFSISELIRLKGREAARKDDDPQPLFPS